MNILTLKLKSFYLIQKLISHVCFVIKFGCVILKKKTFIVWIAINEMHFTDHFYQSDQ